jgi:LPXTG-motif cell wall-anchored protein
MARTIMARTIKVLGLMLLIATMSGTAARAQSESYPPSNVLLALDPVACDATAITGAVEFLQPGSEATITLDAAASGWKALAPIASTSVTVNGEGQAAFTLTVPTGAYGTFTVSVAGLDSNGDPVSVSGSVTLVKCVPLPDTGSNSTGMFLSIGAVAVMAGLMLVVATTRRRRSSATA